MIFLAGSNLAVNYLVDRQKIYDQLSEAIEKQTGRKIKFDHLSFRIIPWPELTASNVKLGNMQNGKAAYFISSEQFTAKFNLWSLFNKNINFYALHLSNVKLFLEKNKSSEKNWEFSPIKDNNVLSNQNNDRKNHQKKWSVNFKSIILNNIETWFDDYSKNKHVYVKLNIVELNQLENDKIRFDISGKNHQANFIISGRINHIDDLLKNKIPSSPVKFQMVLSEYLQNQNVGNIHINGTIKDFIKQKNYSITARGAILNLQNLNLLFPHANLPSIENITFNTVIEDDFLDKDHKSRPEFKVLQLHTGTIHTKLLNINFDLTNTQILANEVNQNINIQLNGKMNGAFFRWAGDVGTLSNFQYNLFSANQKEIPIKGSFSSDNCSAQLYGTIGGNTPILKAKINALKLNKEFNKFGNMQVHDVFYDGKLILPFNVKVKSFKKFQDDLLNSMKIEGSINGKKLNINQFDFDVFSTYFIWENKRLYIDFANLINSQNSLKFSLDYLMDKKDPHIQVTIFPSIIPMEWIEQNYKLAELYAGSVGLVGNLTAKGFNYDEWSRSTRGHIGIAGIGGTLKAEGLKHYVGKAADTLPLKKNISTQCLAVHLNINQDQLNFDTFTVQTKKFVLNGTGNYSITSHNIDFHIVPDIMLGSFSASAPIKLTGNINKPDVHFEKNKDKIFTLSINTLNKLIAPENYCEKALQKAREQ